MESARTSKVPEPSDQELVDLYVDQISRLPAAEMTDSQIRHASQAAYVLELRGYVEQAGTWLHNNRPALHATA